jgi:hypothetical protein
VGTKFLPPFACFGRQELAAAPARCLVLSATTWEGTMTGSASRKTLAAYAASIFVIAGLLSIVAIGGSAVSSKKSAYFATPQLHVAK